MSTVDKKWTIWLSHALTLVMWVHWTNWFHTITWFFGWSERKPSELALVDPLRHVSITRFILVIVVDVDIFDLCALHTHTFNTLRLFESKKTSHFLQLCCLDIYIMWKWVVEICALAHISLSVFLGFFPPWVRYVRLNMQWQYDKIYRQPVPNGALFNVCSFFFGWWNTWLIVDILRIQMVETH